MATSSNTSLVERVDVVDGRTARRHRNRDAVLDALIELAREGDQDSEPSVEAVAERAGVSYRSVYRYFDDRTDLMLSAIRRIMGDGYAILDLDDVGEGSLDDRIARLVELFVRAHRALAPLTRLVVRLRADDPAVAELYDDVRRYSRRLVELQFAPELDGLSEHQRRLALVAIGVMLQVESLDYLTHLERLDDASLTAILSRHIRAHLAVDDR